MAKKGDPCSVSFCDDKVTALTGLGICNNCYSGLKYHEKKPMKAKVKRFRQLKKLEARHEILLGVKLSFADSRQAKKRRAAE